MLMAGLMVAGLTLAFGLADSPQASWAENTINYRQHISM